MNGYTLPAVAIWLASLIGGVIADAAEPVFIFVGGGSTVGATILCTFAFSFEDDPDYGQATGRGVVIGGLVGAVVLLADALVGG